MVTAFVALGLASPVRAGVLDLPGSPPPTDGAQATTWTVAGHPCRLIEPLPLAHGGGLPLGVSFGLGSCPGVRPGALVDVEGAGCTLNFLFKGDDDARYIGTAGHCALGTSQLSQDNGERVYPQGRGPVARDGQGNRIGEVAYAIEQQPKDFALIRLDDGVVASPQVCQFGGPVGINDDLSGGPAVLNEFGNPLGLGIGLTGKSLLALDQSDPDEIFALGVAAPGDSGAPVLDGEGRATGVLVGVGAAGIVVTRIAPQVERAAQVLGTDLELQTAPRL